MTYKGVKTALPALFLSAALLFAAAIPALAAETTNPSPSPSESAKPNLTEDKEYIEFCEKNFNKGWNQIIGETLEKWSYKDTYVSMGYRNTVTGEERYLNPDMYIYAASVYKLPLNMYFAELVSEGYMTMDTMIGGFKYDLIQKLSLENSSNPLSEMLRRCFKDFEDYKNEICKYTCANAEEYKALPEEYFKKLEFTPRQMIRTLTVLYDNPAKFPDIIDHMLKAQQKEYFALMERRFPIAHKYGYFRTDKYVAVNDVGIVFMDEPILLAMFTKTGNAGVLGKYCVLMCNYTLRSTEMRKLQTAALDAATIYQNPEVKS